MFVASNEVTEIPAEHHHLAALFTGRQGAVKVAPEGWCLLPAYQKYGKDIKEFQFEEDDTIVMTMPKSGTTWTLDIVWNMKNNADFNHPSAHLPLNVRCPILEMDLNIDKLEKRKELFERIAQKYAACYEASDTFLEVLRKYPKPRIIKTHLAFQLLSDTALTKAKVVYVIRDPRDTCISYYHHGKIFKHNYFEGTFDQFAEAYMEGITKYSPYWPHVGAAWERRHHPNLHIMFYEHMKKQPKAELRKLSKFLGREISETQMEKILEYTSFDAMKTRGQHLFLPEDASSAMNMEIVRERGGFFRQGTAGGWKEVLTDGQKLKFETWMKKNCPDEKILQSFVSL